MNVDIHCHSAEKPFHSGLGNQTRKIFESYKFDIESKTLDKLKKLIESLSNVKLETQSNLDKLFLGDVRVAFVSMTPMERGFTVVDSQNKNLVKNILQSVLGDKNFNRDYLLSSKAINALTGYKVSDIDKIKVEMSHYFDDYFKKEYEYLIAFDGKTNTVNGRKYSVHFPKTYAELEKNIQDKTKVNIILNVEGAHAFSLMPGRADILRWQKNPEINPAYDGVFVNDTTKRIREVKKFKIPLFSVGVAHHCWNQFVGHSRSLAGLIGGLVSQEMGINTGIHENGKVLLKEISKSDHYGTPTRSMVIDIKHMSCQARKEFYALRKRDSDLKNKGIYCSHTGICMSLTTLDEWIEYLKHDKTKESRQRSATNGRYYLHEKSINTCREDLRELYNADGILGIQLDEKRIMGEMAIQELKRRPDECKYVYAKTLWANIFCAVDELVEANVRSKTKIWDLFSIGSDFDGLINHLDTFPDAASFNAVRATMLYFLEEPEDITLYSDATQEVTLTVQDLDRLKFGFTNQELVNKLFSENAMAFLKRFF